MTDQLNDDHPYKDYQFEDVVAVKGYTNPQTKTSTPDVMLSSFYHVYLLPQQGNNRVDSPRKGWVTTKGPIEWQKMTKERIKFTYHYDEVIVLHDPTRK